MLSKKINNKISNKWFQFILENPNKPWNWNSISQNPNITMDIIRENPDKPWDWEYISRNPFAKWRETQVNELKRKYIMKMFKLI